VTAVQHVLVELDSEGVLHIADVAIEDDCQVARKLVHSTQTLAGGSGCQRLDVGVSRRETRAPLIEGEELSEVRRCWVRNVVGIALQFVLMAGMQCDADAHWSVRVQVPHRLEASRGDIRVREVRQRARAGLRSGSCWWLQECEQHQPQDTEQTESTGRRNEVDLQC
jgi:hypothetical protein